jgi:hypothetical protein
MAQELDAGEFIMKPYLVERLGMAGGRNWTENS